jgi:hypothetical protein
VLYLGEINDQQQASWRRTLAVFDEDKQQYTNLNLFPDDRPLPEDAVDSIQVRGPKVAIPRGATRVSVKGKFLIPGLWDVAGANARVARVPGEPRWVLEGATYS